MNDSHDLTGSTRESRPSPASSVDEPDGSSSRPIAEFEALISSVQKLATVGRLTAGVAHEFNNLLQGIVGSLEVVRKLIARGRAAETEKFSSAALDSARRAAMLTERLLHFARPTEAPQLQPVEVNACIAAMLGLLRGTQSAAIRIDVTPAADLWTVVCDSHRLEEAIVNLVANARDAMPHGGSIHIESRNADLREPRAAHPGVIPSGRYVCISITDSGPGMSREQMRDAFDPYAESHPASSTSRVALWMVHRFAREAGGHTDIENGTEGGSSVRIYLPAA
jgi:signal transduction histidine kinase